MAMTLFSAPLTTTRQVAATKSTAPKVHLSERSTSVHQRRVHLTSRRSLKCRIAAPESTEVTEQETLYDEIGGAVAVEAAVDLFYQKVYSDSRVVGWFDGIDRKKQMAKMIGFMTCVLKGRVYVGNLTTAHAKLVREGLGDGDFDAVGELLGQSLQELNVPTEHIETILGAVESTRAAVLGKLEEDRISEN